MSHHRAMASSQPEACKTLVHHFDQMQVNGLNTLEKWFWPENHIIEPRI